MAKFGIVVDYYLWDEVADKQYTSPHFLYTDRSKFKLLTFDESLNREDMDLRLFDTREEAEKYMEAHDFFEPQICYENPRVVQIGFKLIES